MHLKKCPLCESNGINELERIKTKDVIWLYHKIGINVRHFFIEERISFAHCRNCDLRFFNPLITGDEPFYNSLQKYPWYYLDEKDEYKYALQYIRPSDKLLEIGCGKGAFSELLPTKDYTGLEFSQRAIDIAKNAGIVVHSQSIQEHVASYPAYYDVVCFFQVLEHVSNIHNFLDAAIKTIKPGGILILAVPSEDSFLKYTVNNILNLPPHHVSRWSDQSLGSVAKLFNLQLIEIHHEKVQPIHQKLFLLTFLMNSVFKVNKSLDCSLGYRLLSKFASKIIQVFFSKKLDDRLLPNGHTAMAIYQKI